MVIVGCFCVRVGHIVVSHLHYSSSVYFHHQISISSLRQTNSHTVSQIPTTDLLTPSFYERQNLIEYDGDDDDEDDDDDDDSGL